MRLAGKVVVVTGAGSGLGQALALELLRRGARVAAVDLRSEGLQETMAKAGSLGEGLSLHPLDITDKEKVAALPEEVERVHGQVDGLINNAGIQRRAPLAEMTDAQWRGVLDANLTSVFLVARAVASRMIARGAGKIINTCSVMSEVSRPTIASAAARRPWRASARASARSMNTNSWFS